MVSSTIFAEAAATKVLKMYPPALVARKIDRKLMSCAGWAFADVCDVLPDVRGQIIDVMGIVRIIVGYGATIETTGSALDSRIAIVNMRMRAII